MWFAYECKNFSPRFSKYDGKVLNKTIFLYTSSRVLLVSNQRSWWVNSNNVSEINKLWVFIGFAAKHLIKGLKSVTCYWLRKNNIGTKQELVFSFYYCHISVWYLKSPDAHIVDLQRGVLSVVGVQVPGRKPGGLCVPEISSGLLSKVSVYSGNNKTEPLRNLHLVFLGDGIGPRDMEKRPV